MIVTNIIGGLGNQMFQYAVGKALSLQKQEKLKLDITAYEGRPYRSYELDIFNLDVNIASKKEIKQVKQDGRHYKEKYFHFDPKVLDLNSNTFLQGFWQSEKYFIDYKDVIQKDFTFKSKLSQQSSQFHKLILSITSVSLHIRRGDYVTNSWINTCSIEYYKNAVYHIEKKLDKPHFFIFSDDLDWAKKNLDFITNITFVELDSNVPDHEEMYLMSQCENNIIANSSFSWWGAYLNQNVDKIVIAPKKWFIDETINTKDLIPNSWIRLNDNLTLTNERFKKYPKKLSSDQVDLNDKITVSVCVMSYNLEKYIAKALDSILIQKVNFRYNIVVGEDCSTDKTRQILQDYVKKYPNIFKVIFHQNNIGMLANFAATLKECEGKYIALLDGDDYWTNPLKLQKQVDFLERNKDYSMVFHNIELHDHTENGVIVKPFNLEKNSREYTYDEIVRTWSAGTCSVLCINNKQYQYIEKNLWFPVQDLPFYLSCASIGKIYYMSESMSVYRQLLTGSQKSKKFKSLKHNLNFIKYLETLYNDFSDLISQKTIGHESARHYHAAAYKCKSNNNMEDYRKYLVLAMKHDPEFIYEKENNKHKKTIEAKNKLIQQQGQNLKQQQTKINMLKNNRWYRFGMMSKKRKIWTIGKVVSKKIKLYWLLQPIVKSIKKILVK